MYWFLFFWLFAIAVTSKTIWDHVWQLEPPASSATVSRFFFFFMSIILPYGDTIQIKPQSLYLDWWGRFKENKRIRH